VFDDENLKFVSNQAVFNDQSAARDSLMSIKKLWDSSRDTIQNIQIDGYIAHYTGTDSLSQQRAEQVKKMLVDMGIPSNKISATGRGFGPYQQDIQNRMVKVMVNRNSEMCEN
jgi:outer membrane protein OmpA-like peptidoglycan-associated protein